jgi:hypothetical protein
MRPRPWRASSWRPLDGSGPASRLGKRPFLSGRAANAVLGRFCGFACMECGSRMTDRHRAPPLGRSKNRPRSVGKSERGRDGELIVIRGCPAICQPLRPQMRTTRNYDTHRYGSCWRSPISCSFAPKLPQASPSQADPPVGARPPASALARTRGRGSAGSVPLSGTADAATTQPAAFRRAPALISDEQKLSPGCRRRVS